MEILLSTVSRTVRNTAKGGVLFGAILSACVAAGHGQPADRSSAMANEQSCRVFLQQFYNWYAALPDGQDGLTAQLSSKQQYFDPKLWAMLAAVDEAQKHTSENVLLDFDPIRNSQDLSQNFVVEKVSVQDRQCNAFVRGHQDGERVFPELRFSQGRWLFVNFHYENETNGKTMRYDLVGLLTKMQKEREQKQETPK
jgi:hypothetical protein